MRPSKVALCAVLVGLSLAGAAADAQQSASVVGRWIGALDGGLVERDRRSRQLASSSVPVLLLVATEPGGRQGGILARLDTNRMMLVESVRIEGDAVLFEVPDIPASYSGKLSADGKVLTGAWTDGKTGKSSPLEFTKAPP